MITDPPHDLVLPSSITTVHIISSHEGILRTSTRLLTTRQPHFTLVFLGYFPVECPAEASSSVTASFHSTMASASHRHQDLSGLDPSAFPLCSCQQCRPWEQPIPHPSVTRMGPNTRSQPWIHPPPSSVICSSDLGLGMLLDITRHHELGPLLIHSVLLPLSPCFLLLLLSHSDSSKHWSLSSSPQATQQTVRMTMMCSGLSAESLHVLGTFQYLIESALQIRYHPHLQM